MGKRILIVEDDRASLKLATDVLVRAGYEVVAATTIAEALSCVREQPLDTIVMDMRLPDGDGLDATAAIRALPGGAASLPIIAVTAHAMHGDEEKFLAAGCDRYLAKPIRYKALLGMIEELTARSCSEELAIVD